MKKGRFDALATPSPTPSPAKGEVEQDWDLEGLEELDSEGEFKEVEDEDDEETVLAFIEKGDFKGATDILIQLVVLLQAAVDTLTSQNKSLETDARLSRALLKEKCTRNAELVRAGKEVIDSFQERERKLATLEEENTELTCRLRTISQAVSNREEFYKDLLAKYKVQWEELTEKNVVKGVEREMERWEKKRLEEL